MERFWELFDDMDEYVYVADADTYELVYINKKLASRCGVDKPEDILGQKCYAAIQRCATPCEICPCKKCQPGSFYEWWLYNPIFGQNLEVKDIIYEMDGRRYHLEISIDIDSMVRQVHPVHPDNVDSFTNEVLRHALQKDIPDESIALILEYLGKMLESERVYIYEKNDLGNDDNTYEWFMTGLFPTKHSLQNVPAEVFAKWYAFFDENQNIVIEHVEDIKESDPLHYETLVRRNITSTFAIPLYDGKRVFGFCSVGNPSSKRLSYGINVLHTMGYFITACIKRRDLIQQLKREEADRAGLKLQKDISETLTGAQMGICTILFGEGKPKYIVDSTTADLLGISVDLPPEDVFEFWYANIDESYKENVSQCLEKLLAGQSAEVVYPYYHPQRGFIMIRCGGVRDMNYEGAGQKIRGYHQDISEYHNNLSEQMALNEMLAIRAQENLDMINQIIGSGFWYTDFNEQGEMIRVSWSKEFRNMLGFQDQSDFPDCLESFSSRVHPEDRESVMSAYWESIEYDCPFDTKCRVMKKDGEYNLFHASGLTARYADGAPRLFVGTFINLTKDIRAREALEQARQEAERANAVSLHKSAFMANMSHELRTPINVILGMDEMILREGGDGVTRARALDIKSAAQILLSLINDILDFSKIESGQMHIISGEYNLVNVLSDLALLSESRARQKSLVFEMEISPDLPIGLYGDDLHIRQVVTNLLTNAIKYTSEGTVTLRMSGKKMDEHTILIHCEVEDTGMGIRQEDIDKLFIPYSRVDEYRNRNVEGTGLGLPIIINLLKLMGSELQVDSVYGQGSLFHFDLKQDIVDHEEIGDIHQRMKDAAKEYEYKVSFVAPKARVLVVDDNSMNRDIFTALLQKTKIQITAVSSGQKCLDLVQKESFDIIFMDHLMPEMDGVETLHRLKTMERNLCRDTPVIALTANAFNGDRERYMALGFDDFLSKPIVTEKLEAMIRQVLPSEYVEETVAEASAPEEKEEEDLPDIEGVDWSYATLRIKDHSLLLRALKKFYTDLPGEYQAISEMVEDVRTQDGLDRYRIRVHAMKSTAAQIGILSVSTLAKILEFAARDGEIERIEKFNPLLLDEMESMRERLASALGESDQKPLADLSELSGFLDMLQFYMAQMDIGQAFSVLDQIKSYSYPPELRKYIDEIIEKVSALEFDDATEKIEQMVEELGLEEDEDEDE